MIGELWRWRAWLHDLKAVGILLAVPCHGEVKDYRHVVRDFVKDDETAIAIAGVDCRSRNGLLG
jgi:hypothetical protein